MFKISFKDYEESKYVYVGEFHEDLAYAVTNENLFGFIDRSGKEVIPCLFEFASDFHEGLARVKVNGKFGFIDKSGREVVPIKLEDAHDFKDGVAIVKEQNEQPKYINIRGNVLLTQVVNPRDFSDGIAVLERNGIISLFDGQKVIDTPFCSCSDFKEGYAIAMTTDEYHLVTKDLEIVATISKEEIASIEPPSCELCKVTNTSGLVGYMDTSFHVVIPCIYRTGSNFKEGMAIVDLDERVTGILNKKGQAMAFIKASQYDHIAEFNQGLARVHSSTGFGFIDKRGQLIIPCFLKDADSFHEGLCGILTREEKLVFVDRKGRVKIPEATRYLSTCTCLDQTKTISADSKEELRDKKIAHLDYLKSTYIDQITSEFEQAQKSI